MPVASATATKSYSLTSGMIPSSSDAFVGCVSRVGVCTVQADHTLPDGQGGCQQEDAAERAVQSCWVRFQILAGVCSNQGDGKARRA
jgi:hypothetical protein